VEIEHAIEVQAGAGWTEPKWTWAGIAMFRQA
jgi:hypothetical protein